MIRLPNLPVHTGADSASIAMPLGGIGTGTVAIAGDGSLRQWQLHNTGDHTAFVPDTFFAIRTSQPSGPNVYRALEATPAEDPECAPLTDDGFVPDELRRRHKLLSPMASSTFRALYPVAEVGFKDEALPVQVTLQAWNPFVPLDETTSSIPAALFEFRLTNPSNATVTGWLGASAQNSVGWDGVGPLRGTAGAGYGGNVNRFTRRRGWSGLVMESAWLPSDHPSAGQLVLGTDGAGAHALEQFVETTEFHAFLRGRYIIDHHLGALTPPRVAGQGSDGGMAGATGPSPAGRTWNGAIAVPFLIPAHGEATVRFWLTWSFPNRYVNFVQFGERPGLSRSRLWLGNHYTSEHPDAVATAELIAREHRALADATQPWVDAMGELDPLAAEHLAAQASLIRCPTVFRTENGALFGFEGVQGASTGGWAHDGGSCPLNCTHVWNYEQALSRLFPRLELTMRNTEFDVSQAPDGHVPHRVIVPTFVRQPWGEPIGGPLEPALDGMLGLFLKTLREVQLGAADTAWLRRRWPALLRLLDHIRNGWDPAGSGTLRGIQPSTFDIPLQGLNPYIGGYWLAALLAAARLAELVGDQDAATDIRALFERGHAAYDTALWGDGYYRQELALDDTDEYSWGDGCFSDQLVGQWWAHLLGLGHILPVEHVRAALDSVLAHNFRSSFHDVVHDQRVFADGDDAGLVNCSWPRGGRPQTPVWYCDEVWTGVEYQVAASCFFEGRDAAGKALLDAVWTRYDGRRRNPFNEIECGDHYARAMAGFAVLDAIGGVRFDASDRSVHVRRAADGTTPLFAGTGWGVLVRRDGCVEVRCLGGRLRADAVVLDHQGKADAGSAPFDIGHGESVVLIGDAA